MLCVGSGGTALLRQQLEAQGTLGERVWMTHVLVIPGIFPWSLSRDKSFLSGDSLFSEVTSCKKWSHGEGYDMWTWGNVKGGQLFESLRSSFDLWKQTVQSQVKCVVAFPRFCGFRIQNICLSAILYLHRMLRSHRSLYLVLVMCC